MKTPTPIHKWSSANQGFFYKFVAWLEQGGYGPSARKLYGCAARIALGWLDTAYWMIALPGDIDRVRAYMAERYESEATRATYLKGIAKLEDFLYQTCHKPKPEKPINWSHYIGPLPQWLADDGSRIWVDGHLVLDQWHANNGIAYCGTYYATAGNHEVIAEYYEDGGQALIYVWWEPH